MVGQMHFDICIDAKTVERFTDDNFAKPLILPLQAEGQPFHARNHQNGLTTPLEHLLVAYIPVKSCLFRVPITLVQSQQRRLGKHGFLPPRRKRLESLWKVSKLSLESVWKVSRNCLRCCVCE